MNAIETIELTKKYGEFTAVDGLNLTIEKGELFSLLGVNGAGKTTTIKMLACLTAPTSGDAIILGESIRKSQDKIKGRLSISPQETAVARNLTVTENLEMMAGIFGQNKTEAKNKTNEIIRELKLDEVSKKKAKSLSGGMQRRLSIAMSLISEPEVLFLDEPTLGLDVIARRELWNVIRGLKGKTTIIMTTHYMEETEALSDRVGIIAHGRLKAVGTTQELIDKAGAKNFEDAFVDIATSEGGLL